MSCNKNMFILLLKKPQPLFETFFYLGLFKTCNTHFKKYLSYFSEEIKT